MSNLKRSHTLYLQSKHRDAGTTSQYTISLPGDITNDVNTEIFKLSLVSFSTYHDMLQVKDGYDTVYKNNQAFKISHGSYTFQKLVRELQNVLDTNVVWDVETNTVTFVFQTNTTIRFDGVARILGFDESVIYSGVSVTSIRPLRPYSNSHIMIHLNNIQPVAEHLCLSNHTGEVRIANVLAKVLINAPPFQLVTHEQVLESDGLYSADNSLQVLEFVLTDNDGEFVQGMPEHELVLRIESIDVEDVGMNLLFRELKEIKTTLKDMFMYKALRFRQ